MKRNQNKKKPQGNAKFNLPVGLSPKTPFFELYGNREVCIEGCSGVLEYDDQIVRISTGSMIVSFKGRGLVIKCLSESSLIIKGYIKAIEYLT